MAPLAASGAALAAAEAGSTAATTALAGGSTGVTGKAVSPAGAEAGADAPPPAAGPPDPTSLPNSATLRLNSARFSSEALFSACLDARASGESGPGLAARPDNTSREASVADDGDTRSSTAASTRPLLLVDGAAEASTATGTAPANDWRKAAKSALCARTTRRASSEDMLRTVAVSGMVSTAPARRRFMLLPTNASWFA